MLETFLTGDPRDVEITNLKIRLVRAEKERAEMAAKATQDKRTSQIKLHQATRMLEQAQHLTEQLRVRFLFSIIRQTPSANQDVVISKQWSAEEEETVQFAASMIDAFLAKAEKLNID